MEFKFLLGIKVMYLVDRTDLFRAGGLVLGAEMFVMNLHSRLEEQRAWESNRGIETEKESDR